MRHIYYNLHSVDCMGPECECPASKLRVLLEDAPQKNPLVKEIWARIWSSAPHEVDGIFVEILERRGNLDVQGNCDWVPTVEAAKQYALDHHAARVEEL